MNFPIYLGDGVYIDRWDEAGLQIYASDGILKSPPIFLEPEVLVAFHRTVVLFMKEFVQQANSDEKQTP